jgi:hypothetical protein
VQHVAVATSLPPEQSFLEIELSFGPSRAEVRRTGRLVLASVTKDYFAALGIPLVSGRLPDADLDSREGTAVLSRSAARAVFEDRDPIGRQLPTSLPGVHAKSLTVIGVVGDVKYAGLHAPAGGTIYVPWQLLPVGVVQLIVRAERDAVTVAPPIRDTIHRLDPAQPVGDIQPLERTISESIADRRLHAVLATSFAGLAFLLALVGLSAALSQSVSERRRELAVRMALGSDPSRTVRHVVGGGVRLVALGLVAGLVVAAFVTRGLAGFLYGLSPLDPATFLTVSAVVGVVSLMACYLPARLAAGIEPSELLRME